MLQRAVVLGLGVAAITVGAGLTSLCVGIWVLGSRKSRYQVKACEFCYGRGTHWRTGYEQQCRRCNTTGVIVTTL